MKVPLPEKRRCEECSNTMTLNLFRLNSSTCRYCQEGITVPSRLIEEQRQNEVNISLETNNNLKGTYNTDPYSRDEDEDEDAN